MPRRPFKNEANLTASVAIGSADSSSGRAGADPSAIASFTVNARERSAGFTDANSARSSFVAVKMMPVKSRSVTALRDEDLCCRARALRSADARTSSAATMQISLEPRATVPALATRYDDESDASKTKLNSGDLHTFSRQTNKKSLGTMPPTGPQ